MRLGLVGYSCNTGLGELNRQIAEYCHIDHWLVKPHRSKKTNSVEQVSNVTVGHGNYEVERFLSNIDTVLFCETPYYDNLVVRAKELGKRVVCIPMQEWIPTVRNWWVDLVDLFICPNQHSYDEFKDTLPCALFPWPVDLKRYEFKKRTKCSQFLFINGNGGWGGRKGMRVIQELVHSWPEIPLTVRSQVGVPHLIQPKLLEGEVKNNQELYSVGDVLLCPHFVDGLGLELMEAAACGIPVIATDGRPWDEHPCIDYINSHKTKNTINREVDWYTPSATDLASICLRLLGSDIEGYSQLARKWAEGRDWTLHAKKFRDLVLNGKRTVELGLTEKVPA